MSGGCTPHTLDPGCFGLSRADLPPIQRVPQDSRFDLQTLFPEARRGRPLELEIGSGKGTFLVQQATTRPQANYLGIEWAREYWLHAADRLRRHGLTHARLLHADAAEFVRWHCPDACFAVIHVYFPDPWPKKRHHKRRLIQGPFLREAHRTLCDAGELRLVTDHSEYFAWMAHHVEQVAELFERCAFEPPQGAGEGEVVGTNFERKYRREGRPFHAMTLRKRG